MSASYSSAHKDALPVATNALAAVSGGAASGARNGDDAKILDAVSKNLSSLKGRVGAEDARRIEAHIAGRFRKHCLVGEIGTFREIQFHQPLLHLRGLADLIGPVNQPMAVGRIGLAAQLVDRVDEAILRCRRRGERQQQRGCEQLASRGHCASPKFGRHGAGADEGARPGHLCQLVAFGVTMLNQNSNVSR